MIPAEPATRASEPRTSGPRISKKRAAEPRAAEPRASRQRAAASRKSAPPAAEPGSAETGGESRTSEARERLLNTATTIFYASGIHSVGVDRIVAEAKITRATFYRHFPSKEDLVVAYLDRIHGFYRAQAEQVTASGRPAIWILRSIGRGIVEEVQRPGFRGCAFLNAAAEYPDTGHPVYQAVLAHRTWFQETIVGLFAKSGHEAPETAGRLFVMLRDGVMAAGCLEAPISAGETFLHGIDTLLGVRV